jgi:hypothetical protein
LLERLLTLRVVSGRYDAALEATKHGDPSAAAEFNADADLETDEE